MFQVKQWNFIDWPTNPYLKFSKKIKFKGLQKGLHENIFRETINFFQNIFLKEFTLFHLKVKQVEGHHYGDSRS